MLEPTNYSKRVKREVPSVVAVLCVVSSGGLVSHIVITSCTPPLPLPPSTEMSKKNDYEMTVNTIFATALEGEEDLKD